MVDHIFNEARSGEVLHELRAEAEHARLARQSRQTDRTPRGARSGTLAGVVAASTMLLWRRTRLNRSQTTA